MAGRAVRGGRDPGHDATRPGRRPTTSSARWRRRVGATRRRAPGSPTSRSSPATGSTVETEATLVRASPPSSPTTSPSSAPTSSRPSTTGAPTTTSSSSAARCSPPARRTPAGSTSSASEGAFDAEQSRAVLEAGRAAGLGLRVHGNQLGPGPRRRARGRDRAPRRSTTAPTSADADIEALAGERHRRHLPARRPTSRPASPIRMRGGRSMPASASRSRRTCNPGSSYTTSMSFCIALAVRELGMTIEEARAGGDAGRGDGAATRPTSAAWPPAPGPTRSSSTHPPTPT